MGQEVVGERKGQSLWRRGESRIHIEFAFWPGNYRVKTGLFPLLNRETEVQRLQCGGEFFGIGRFRSKTEKRAPFRGIHRRMGGTLAPLNEKRQEARVSIGERHRLPFQELSVRALARAWRWPFELDFRGTKLFSKRGDAAGMSGPANQTRFRERMQARGKRIFHPGLCRIRRNDFQIAALSQRKERVLRAASRMNAPKRRAHACVLFDERDAALQISRAKKNMIEQGWTLAFRQKHGRGHNGATC